MKDVFYITTPIYYVNDVPHIGHAYTTISADVLARFKRCMGFKTFFLTGTDEHGRKVEKSAEELNLHPKELADRVCVRFKELWEKLKIQYSRFIRTTDPDHEEAVTELWKRIYEKGDIYRGNYRDWYCTPCESFWTSSQLVQGKCPDCGREVELLEEESFFFRLSNYGEALLKFYEENPQFVEPASRMNEILSFVRRGLKDISLSRLKLKWGIKVPQDENHTIYVWFDALTNYLTGAGFPSEGYDRIWPADVHIVGKDILRFHAVYWPAFLLSAGIIPPRKIFAHGWWTVNGEKMSKSKGNVVDPLVEIENYGVDRFRYFLFREVPFGLDGDYSSRSLIERCNFELSNDIGNLFSRVCTMIRKYKNGSIITVRDGELKRRLEGYSKTYMEKMEGLSFYHAITEGLLKAVRETNLYVDRKKPWEMAKRKNGELDRVLGELGEALRIIACLLYPFTPGSAIKMLETLGYQGRGEEDFSFTWLEENWKTEIKEVINIFPRIE